MDKRLFGPLGMKDTTFWPDAGQVARLAKTYKPDASKKKLALGGLAQLQADLSDRSHRFPMPAGGLFSTAEDVARFCRMLLNGGELDGRRYLSLASVQALSVRQTPKELKESYGLGFAVGADFFGHGGAQATGMACWGQLQGLTGGYAKRTGIITGSGKGAMQTGSGHWNP